MKIHEYQAKALFKNQGIPVPEGGVAGSEDDVAALAAELGGRVAVKAQVHAGGRGKAGGVKVAADPAEAAEAARAILGMDIKGSIVRKVLVEQAAEIAREAYLGIVVDRSQRSISFIGCAEGGVEIEELAAREPEKILRVHALRRAFPEAEARELAGRLLGEDADPGAVLEILRKLFELFVAKDCSLAEINPLILTRDGSVVALDGKMNFDDNALFRHPDIVALRDLDEENAAELKAKEQGLSYVALDGNIGCMVNGAGLAMATMDLIQQYGGAPANFLDVGGSSNPEKVVNAFRLILKSPAVKAVLINIFGGITRCDDIARGILEAFRQIEVPVPVVVRLYGTNHEQGMKLLEGTELVVAGSLADGIARAVALAKGGAA